MALLLKPHWFDALNHDWPPFAHAHQHPPDGDWTTWLLLGGRGAGKTRAGAEWVKRRALHHPKQGPIALIGETEHDAREVMVEGVSGLLSAHTRSERPEWSPSRRRLEWSNGAVAQVFSADNPESLRGPQFAAAWCDELAKWRHQYSDHPSDPGGPTNFGITIGDYRRYVKPDATAADVRALRLDEAKAIYRSKYWNAMRCDELAAGLDYAVFDYAVNSGTTRAAKVLQRLLALADDGKMSDTVLAATRKRDAADLIARLCDERLAFLKRLKTWSVFGAGWGRRVADVRAAALATAAQAKSAATTPAPGQTAAPVNTPVRTTIAGVVAAIAVSAAHWAAAPLTKETTMSILVLILAAIGGYAASVFTWPRLRQALVGLENEIDDLRAKARALEARLRG